jgi:xanthine dehydrogenase YagT iron-sulfur-binding subunit
MSSKKGFSRRGFLQGAGIGGVLGTGLLERGVEAAPEGAVVAGPGPVPVTLTVNGKPVTLTVEPRVTLLDALRNQLDLTGAKRVCDLGTCGACTVLMDGKSVYSCIVLAIDAQGKSIETIEGMTSPEKMHPVSQAFWENDGQQCGYCTSGFVVACAEFLTEHPNPTEEDVKNGLGGNLCRCGSYVGVRAAALQAAKAIKGGKNA